MRCCVPFCKNTLDDVSTSEEDGEGISFHGFPSEEHLRAAWLRALGKQDSHLPDSAVVCSQHFLNDDIYKTECGFRQIVTSAIPSTVQVCMICLDTDSKLILMSNHKLEETYEKLTGHPLCDQGNLKQTLCVQCAQRLINFSRFRDKSLRARALMMDLVDKHELITRRHIKMINHTKHQLKSSMVLTKLGPDHCDLHILEHDSEDKQTELEEIGLKGEVKTEESDDSMSVEGDMEVKHEEDNNVNDFVQDPLKYESAPLQCTLHMEEFFHDHKYMQQMSVHLQNGEGVGECDTSQVCKPHTAVSSSSSHSSLVTENKSVAAQTTVAPVSATFATNNENKVHTTKEVDTEKNFTQKLGGLENTSVDSKIFPNCEVRLCDIFKKPKAQRQDQALKKTRKSVSGIQNIASIDFSHQATSQNEVPTTEYIEPVTNSRSRVKETVSKTLQSITDGIHNIQCNNSSQYSSHTAKSLFICNICGKKIKRKSMFVKHVKNHAEERRFTCKICQHKCKFNCDFVRHMRTHTGEKPFICNSKFAQSSVLESHMTIHSGIKPYACELCEFIFSRKSNLVRHMRIHTGEKPYSCQICKYKCSYKSSIVSHMRTHTGIKPYACELCEYKCAQKSYLVKHIKTHTKERWFTCKICQYKCKRNSNLAKHMRTHTRENPFTCNSKFAQSSVLESHMSTHTGIKPYACELCEFKFSRKSSLVRHMRIHTGEKPYSCQTCEYKCSDKSSLVSHMRTHTGEKPFTCSICNSKFSQSSALVCHMRTHTGEKPYTCNICNSKFARSSLLVCHMRTHTGEKPFTCNICNSKFSHSSALVCHMRTHTGEKPYTCNICNSKFARSSLLVCHMRTHTGEKPFTCNICNSKFARSSLLVCHMRTHTGEKPYTCNICNSKFARSSLLVCHMRTHTGEKPFTCNMCNSKFSQSSALVCHMRTHTGEKPYTCNICNSKFARSSLLVCHMRTHTGIKPYACELCEYNCSQKRSLAIHMRIHTGEKPYF